jgi:hypothetical protein
MLPPKIGLTVVETTAIVGVAFVTTTDIGDDVGNDE